VYLYEDANGNGVVDVATDALVGTAVTATNGTYLFTNLFATNTYLVYVDRTDPDLPPAYYVTGDPFGALDGRSVVTITNASRLDQDFGFQPYGTGAIGDTVWRDLNADGVKSGVQETGISNVLVTLYVDFNGDGTYLPLRSTNTSSTGTYLFTNLPDGQYRVVVDAADADLPQDAFGNVFYPSTATTNNATIAGGNTYLDADFGFAPYAAIGDTVFWDANRNGTQDYSEEGVAGVTVNLFLDVNGDGFYDAGDTFVSSAVTDADGLYLFSGLMPGSYVVAVDGASGPLAGAFLSADPDSNGLTCEDLDVPQPCDGQHGRTLVNSQNYMGADFGYVPPGAVIGDTLWIDTDNDGVRDGNESGIAYVSVVLWSNGVAIATNETDGDGWYYFSNLGDGTFQVVVVGSDPDFPPGLTQTYDPDGVLDGVGSNVVVSNGVVTAVGGWPCLNCNFWIDFGYRYAGNNSLSGTIGFDATPYDGVLNGTNWNGVATNEIAYADVQVYLYLWNDDLDGIVEPGEYVLVSSTFTSTNGDYSFTGLPNGDGDDKYIVASLAPEDYLKLTTANGSISGVGVVETANPQGNTDSAYLTVAIAPEINGMDFAYRSTKVYDYGDLPDSYQTTIPGGARHMVTYLTNLYLGAGVDVEANGVPATLADGDDLAGTDDEDGVLMLGRWAPGAAGGTVQVTVGKGSGWLLGFIDFNRDGDFADGGDLAVNQAVATNGGPGLDGVYEIALDVPAGSLSTTNSTVLYARFRLFPSAPFLPELAYSGTADNGEVEDYRWILHVIRGTVFADADATSDFSGGDTTIPGTVVHLYDGANNLIASAVTDLSGNYAFIGLPDGNYRVEMEAPTGTTAILDRDGNGNGATNIAVTVSGASVFTRDFLVDNGATLADISGTVWEDNGYGVAGNGLFDGPDRPVPGTTVALYRDIDGDGLADPNEWIAEMVTDVNGDYAFNNLPNGNYLVVMTTPAGATSITDVDEAVQLNGSTLIEVPLAGVDVIDRDFLVDGAPPASLSGLIWFDANRNGIRAGSETNRFAGIPVYLLDADSNVVASVTTGVSGAYAFTNLAPAYYFVRFDLAALSTNDFGITTPYQGTNTVLDSDVVAGAVGSNAYTAVLLLSVGQHQENVDLGLIPPPATWAAVADVWGEWA
ncbi:MAG TPA: SdrD B-like domain-containing protein, partial [Kiritimatiellia bacterium]|nr:SdrD B-like domain-containing protein [Kiritimatiellia bacterium]